MRRKAAWALLAAWLLVMAGSSAIFYPVFTDLRYEWDQSLMAAEAAGAAAANARGGIALPQGTVARLTIPEIGLSAYVMEGTDSDILDRAPGHYPESPLPGEPGNAAIAGHRTMHGHPFRRLDELDAGDLIITWTASRKAVYRVVEIKVVDPTMVGVVAPTDESRLTLTTCHPVGSARQRLVVVARLQGPGAEE
jgi:sortase A